MPRNHLRGEMTQHQRLRVFTLKAVWNRSNRQCHNCKRSISLKETTRDHVIPLVLGGESTWGNIEAACEPCNVSRHRELATLAQVSIGKCSECRYTMDIGSIIRCYAEPLLIKEHILKRQLKTTIRALNGDFHPLTNCPTLVKEVNPDA